jgi:alpha/beta superfamily hydrolase
MSQFPINSSSLRTIDLHGPAGRLEALLNEGHPESQYAVLLCHPHPLGGGTMHNKVVYHAMKVFQELGMPVLRFNFRGTGLSEGSHDHGHGEQDDVHAALNWLDSTVGKPLITCGFSFGAAMSMAAAFDDDRVKALIGLGIPTHAEGRDYQYDFLSDCEKPKLFVSGDRDQYGPKPLVEAVVQQAAEPKKLCWIPDGDHFFLGKLDQMQTAIRSWVESTLL